MTISEAKKRANAKYNAKTYKRIPLDLRHEEAEKVRLHAEKHGEAVNAFIKRAIRETMERDGEL